MIFSPIFGFLEIILHPRCLSELFFQPLESSTCEPADWLSRFRLAFFHQKIFCPKHILLQLLRAILGRFLILQYPRRIRSMSIPHRRL